MATIPEGLFLQHNVITLEKEAKIISWLDSRPWSTELSRRTQHYGYIYNYKGKGLATGPVFEGPILEISQMIQKSGLMNPAQCIVNEYYRNQCIAPHIDNLVFGPVIMGLSIGSDGVMIFKRNSKTFECFLPRRSLIMLSGPARYEWKHGISKEVTYIDQDGTKLSKPEDYRRISLTFRELI